MTKSTLETQITKEHEIVLRRLHPGGFIGDRPGDLSKWLTLIHAPKKESVDHFFKACLPLRDINRHTAFRMLAYLPKPLVNVSRLAPDVESNDLDVLHCTAIAVSSWLMCFELEPPGVRPVLEELFPNYDVRAQLAQDRYNLIRELIARDCLGDFFTKPGLPWLLCEAALCRQQLQNLRIPRSRRDHYDKRKQEIAQLSEFVSNPATSLSIEVLNINSERFITNFEKHIDWLAAERAKQDKKFDKNWYRRYLRSQQSWNVYSFSSDCKLITPINQRQGRERL